MKLFTRPLLEPLRIKKQHRGPAFMAGMAVTIGLMVALGCGTLLPKRVEFFQDKVEQFPEHTAREKETQRQAAAAAAQRATDTLIEVIKTDSPTNVVVPATDTAALTRAVSTSVGPPSQPWQGDFQLLAVKLDSSVAALNKRLDSFKDDNNENAGKKIEGSGLFSVPYFVWLAGVAVAAIIGFVILGVGWQVLKLVAGANPIASVGFKAVELAGSTAAKGFSQVLEAGESFKDSVRSKFGDKAEAILEEFRKHHEIKQDRDVQAAIKALTTKDS